MEMILISANKLKVSLSATELERFELTTDMLDYGNTETKKMLWDILSRAKHSIGFNPDGYRIFVQLYPSKDGSCELFVTKISASESSIYDIFSSENKEFDDQDYTVDSDISDESVSNETSVRVFEMDSLAALNAACRRLIDTSFSSNGAVYILDGIFYLILQLDSQCYHFPIDELSFMGEYGTPKNSDELLMNLYEFGKLICSDNAIKIFSEL